MFVILLASVLSCGLWIRFAERDPLVGLYQENCVHCHGENLEGTPIGTPLVGDDLRHGDSVADVMNSISQGFPARGMPAWSEVLDDAQIQSLAIYILERRVGRRFVDFKVDAPLEIPEGLVESEMYDFRVESVASGLHPLPFSIAPLPDGRILLVEKTRGLSIIGVNGVQSELIRGAPEAHDDGFEMGTLEWGLGWMMDVALHPAYEDNGWIYLHHGHRCSDCNDWSRKSPFPVSMNRLVRGRIRDGAWVDEEILWSTDLENYTSTPDMAAGGRVAFDDTGHVYFSVGMKGTSNHQGIQELDMPYGKIHRLYDDGRVPADNPFVGTPEALDTIWTRGHRSPQGLEFNHRTQQLWGTEMGPRGGDEFNLLQPGRNYGWPLTSKGMDYDGTPVEYGKELGIEFDLDEIEQPVVDWTPAPAVSSFIFYEGDAFPDWRGNAVVGSLKASELYRLVMEDDRVIRSETLLASLARIRDVEIGPDGGIYLLLEHASGGRIVRLVPEPSPEG
ncbi:PQQ-dependent sugar dehydrogenase [Myxococcota bacterium]|nr:PQQ-dependent sugar dehydrogenase [Myxococcota bacterium]